MAQRLILNTLPLTVDYKAVTVKGVMMTKDEYEIEVLDITDNDGKP